MNVAKRLHVLGASGSGTTTLASGLAQHLGVASFDADDYYWEATNPPFTAKRELHDRVARIEGALDPHGEWVLSGSIVNWGDSIKDRFTHVIFLFLPPELRMARLRARERERFGARIDPGGDMHQQHLDFLAWAKRYDDGGLDVRSRHLHEEWFKRLACPILRISGELTTAEQIDRILDQLEN